jgi:hypothetical protein
MYKATKRRVEQMHDGNRRVDGGHDPRQSGEDRAPPPDRFTAAVAAFLRLIPGLA